MPNIIEITDFHAPELDPYARPRTSCAIVWSRRKASLLPRAPKLFPGRWMQAISRSPF